MKKRIGQKIRNLRILNNLSQNELSNALHVTQASLSLYENGNKLPSIDVLIRISEYFDVSLDWLCDSGKQLHFHSISDVILTFFEIKELDGLTINTEIFKNSIERIDNYSCQLSFNGQIINSKNYGDAEDTPAGHLCKFLYDWKNTTDQLNNLSDEEIKKNYYQMWLDKQLEYYSAIPVKTKTEKNQEILDALIGDNKLHLED